jgi:hypothetical protein
MMFARRKNGDQEISKTAAALNYWLQNERNDLPLEITRISFASYNTPISQDGTLPVNLFGGKLNLKRLKEKKIPWLICYGTHDDLVEKETALAPLDHVDAEVTPFPKGHVAIATSWSFPQSACALHTRFGDGDYRGPVRFHMDLDAALDEARREASKAPRQPPATPVRAKVGSATQKPVKKKPAARKATTKKNRAPRLNRPNLHRRQKRDPNAMAKRRPGPIHPNHPVPDRPTAAVGTSRNSIVPAGGKVPRRGCESMDSQFYEFLGQVFNQCRPGAKTGRRDVGLDETGLYRRG